MATDQQEATDEAREVANGLALAYGILSGETTPSPVLVERAKAALRKAMGDHFVRHFMVGS